MHIDSYDQKRNSEIFEKVWFVVFNYESKVAHGYSSN